MASSDIAVAGSSQIALEADLQPGKALKESTSQPYAPEIVVTDTGLTVLNPELPPDKTLVESASHFCSIYIYIFVRANSCSIVFVHGLNGHPRKTWTYEGPKGDTLQHKSREEAAESTSRTEAEVETDQGKHTKFFLEHLKAPSVRLQPSRSRSKGKLKEQTAPVRKNVFFWPQNLPQECMDTARVMTFGYDSHVSKFFNGTANQNTFYQHALNLLGALVRRRANAVCSVITHYSSPY